MEIRLGARKLRISSLSLTTLQSKQLTHYMHKDSIFHTPEMHSFII